MDSQTSSQIYVMILWNADISHKKAFELIVLVPRQSNAPVQCLEQKEKVEVQQRFKSS